MGRDIFLVFDGTNCTRNTKTNILKLEKIGQASGLHVEYFEGPAPNGGLETYLVTTLNTKVRDVYNTIGKLDISLDDRVYMIGYSRGAVVARMIAAMLTSEIERNKLYPDADSGAIIRANVQFLGLFDPVDGPRFSRRKIDDKKVALSESVKNYVEFFALDERFTFFQLDSIWSVKDYGFTIINKIKRKRIGFSVLADDGSFGNLQEIPKTEQTDLQLWLRKTRKVIWFPGKHSDVGGQEGDELIALNSKLTMLEQVVLAARREGIALRLDAKIMRKCLEHYDLVSEDKQPSKVRAESALHQLGKAMFKTHRMVEKDINVFAHEMCIEHYNAAYSHFLRRIQKLIPTRWQSPKFKKYENISKLSVYKPSYHTTLLHK